MMRRQWPDLQEGSRQTATWSCHPNGSNDRPVRWGCGWGVLSCTPCFPLLSGKWSFWTCHIWLQAQPVGSQNTPSPFALI